MAQTWQKSIILILAFSLIQCANIFEPLTPKDTNQALLYEARKKIDEAKYDDALTYLGQLDSTYAAQGDVLLTYASAYAGACGMQFIPFFNSISQASSITPPNTIFKYLRNSFTDKTALPTNCVLAEAKLKAIGSTAALREAAMEGKKEVNMLMAILAMAKIGAVLRTTSDVDGTNGLGDGNTDAGFDSCNSGMLTDNDVIEVGTGFALLIENLPTLLGASNSTSVALDAIGTIIGTFCTLSPTSKCVTLDKSSLDPSTEIPEFVDTYRDLLKSQTAGIETCSPVLPATLDSCCP